MNTDRFLIRDIKPLHGLQLYFELVIEPRRIELAELIANRSGKTNKIKVQYIERDEK